MDSHASVILAGVWYGATTPGRVSIGKLVSGKGPDKELKGGRDIWTQTYERSPAEKVWQWVFNH